MDYIPLLKTLEIAELIEIISSYVIINNKGLQAEFNAYNDIRVSKTRKGQI